MSFVALFVIPLRKVNPLMTRLLLRLSVALLLASSWLPCACGAGEPAQPPPDFRAMLIQELNETSAVVTHAAFAALRQNDVPAFIRALPALVDPAGTNSLDLACLFCSAVLDQPDAMKHLLSLGMPANGPFEPEEGLPPLHIALLCRSESVVDSLLEAGADVHSTNALGMSALGCATAAQLTNRVSDLLARGAAADSSCAQSIPPLRIAILAGDAGIARLLLEAGASVDQPMAHRGTALHMASAENNAHLVQVLLDAGADVRATNQYLSTPLMTAAGNGARDCSQLLLDRGAQINAVDAYGHSPIARAIQRGQLDLLDFLADRGADLAATSNEGWNLLHLAAVQDNADVVRWCIRRNLPLDALKKGDCTALYLAVANNQTNAVQALLDAGADPNLAATNGLWTPLMKTARTGNSGLARLLLSAGADPEIRRLDGSTALLVTAAHASTEMIDLLLDAGARTDAFNLKGEGVLHMAMITTNLAAFTHFLKLNVDPNLASPGKWPVISAAAWHGQTNFIAALLAAGADPDRTTPDGQTPLYVAVRRSQTNVVSQLLDAGANPALRKNENWLTPWHLAILHGDRELAERLELRMLPEQMAPTNLVRAYLDLDAPLATNVFVAGLFNEWNATATPLARREDDGWWYVELDLFPAEYGYKFVVDGNWVEDPLADNSYRDGNRNTENSQFNPVVRRVETRPARPVSSANSLIPVRFEYSDRAARYVSVAGEFNGWNAANHQLSLEKVGLWSAELRIPAGEYAYKFVVDGNWILDPSNASTKIVAGVSNSLLVVQSPASFVK